MADGGSIQDIQEYVAKKYFNGDERGFSVSKNMKGKYEFYIDNHEQFEADYGDPLEETSKIEEDINKKFQSMAHGGELTERAKKVWQNMSYDERMKFLKKQYRHDEDVLVKRLELESKKNWDDLAVGIQMDFEKNLFFYEQGGYMADGGRIANDKQKFGLKILKSLKGFNDGQTLNGVLELLGYSQYRFGKYATESQVNEVKNQLDILIKMGYVEESGIGYKITKEGSNFLNMFNYGSYAQGGVTEKEVVDSNAQMVLSNVKEVKHHADELAQIVTKKSNIEAWVVAKIERASTDLSDITHYLEGQHDKMSMGGSVYNHLHKMDKK